MGVQAADPDDPATWPPLRAAIKVVRPVVRLGSSAVRGRWGAVIVPAIRHVAQLTAAELADTAGCSADLVDAIERGEIAPTHETAERLANSVSLELRMGPAALTGVPAHVAGQFDSDLGRVRDALAAETEFRARFGAGPPAPPAEVVPAWDGTDPAPSRMCSAWPTRTDFGGAAAVALRYARNVVACCDAAELAAAAGITGALLRDLEAGALTLSMDDTETVLNSIGIGHRARLKPYETHDDDLHLAAIAEPRRTLRRLRESRPAAQASSPDTPERC